MNCVRLPIVSMALLGVACGGKEDESIEKPNTLVCREEDEPFRDTRDPGSGPVDCHAFDGYELRIIDTFELGEQQMGWYINGDRTAWMKPAPDSSPITTTPIDGARCFGVDPSADHPTRCAGYETAPGGCADEGPAPMASRSALRITSGFLSSNGATLGYPLTKSCPTDAPECPFLPGPPEIGPCYGLDLFPPEDRGRADDPRAGMAPSRTVIGCHAAEDTSSWEGIAFWARLGPNSGTSIRVRTSDSVTDDKGCVCNTYTNQNDPADGCDKFGKYVNIDATWRAFFVPFREMQQGGWGMNSPGLDTSDLFEVAFELGRGAWDLWLDDVAFYRRKP